MRNGLRSAETSRLSRMQFPELNCHANLHQIYGIPRHSGCCWLLTERRTAAVVGLLALDGEKVIKSLCQSPPLPLSPPPLSRSGRSQSSRESGRDDEHYVDRWTALSVCAKERERRERRGEDEMDVLGKYLASHFSLENGAWRPSKETC